MTHFFTVAPDWKIVPQQDRHSNFSGFYHFIGCTRFSAVSLSIQDEFSMRYWHILKWLNDSHVRQWDHHVDDRSIKSNFSVPFRVAKQSRRSHVKRTKLTLLEEIVIIIIDLLDFLLFWMIEPIVTNVTWRVTWQNWHVWPWFTLYSSCKVDLGQICHVNIPLEFFLIKSFFGIILT